MIIIREHETANHCSLKILMYKASLYTHTHKSVGHADVEDYSPMIVLGRQVQFLRVCSCIKIRSHSISVSIMACHAVGTSSILVETAKF